MDDFVTNADLPVTASALSVEQDAILAFLVGR
jgi:hypothetical protein